MQREGIQWHLWGLKCTEPFIFIGESYPSLGCTSSYGEEWCSYCFISLLLCMLTLEKINLFDVDLTSKCCSQFSTQRNLPQTNVKETASPTQNQQATVTIPKYNQNNTTIVILDIYAEEISMSVNNPSWDGYSEICIAGRSKKEIEPISLLYKSLFTF